MTQPAAQTPSAPASLTLPAGTVIPATLVTAMNAKMKPGTFIRARVAFPVLSGNQLAIPIGTSIEGQIEAAPAKTKTNKHPLPMLHFTTLVFADGSKVPLDALTQNASVVMQGPTMAEDAGGFMPTGHGGGSGFMGEPQQAPQQPVTDPFAHAGPNPAVIYGPIIAFFVVLIGVLLLNHSAHKAQAAASLTHAVGWQFSLVLQQPLVLDAAHVRASAAMPVA